MTSSFKAFSFMLKALENNNVRQNYINEIIWHDRKHNLFRYSDYLTISESEPNTKTRDLVLKWLDDTLDEIIEVVKNTAVEKFPGEDILCNETYLKEWRQFIMSNVRLILEGDASYSPWLTKQIGKNGDELPYFTLSIDWCFMAIGLEKNRTLTPLAKVECWEVKKESDTDATFREILKFYQPSKLL